MRLMPLTMVWSWPWLRMHLEQLGMVLAGRLVADRLVVADLDRVGRVEADDAVVLDVHAGHAVAGGGDDEAVVEADLQRAGLDLAVPVELARRPGPGATCRPRRWCSRPSSASTASVVRPGSMISAASPGRMPVPFLRQAYSPVSSA